MTMKEVTDTTRRICAKVRSLRTEISMSQGEIAAQSGLFREAVSRLERGDISPTVDLLSRVLEPMGYTVDIVRIEDIK